MALQIGAVAPDFEAETTDGKIKFHDWIGNSWALLFSHPKDFTPVCTTELGALAKLKPEFDKRGVKLMGLSVDPVDRHAKWSEDIKETQGAAPNYPMIGDIDFNVSKLYDMLPASTSGDPLTRTPTDNQTVRNVFVIGPDKKIKLVLVYPMTTGRNFAEILRAIDSLQMTAKHRVATPADWKQGEDVIIAGSVNGRDRPAPVLQERERGEIEGRVTKQAEQRAEQQGGLPGRRRRAGDEDHDADDIEQVKQDRRHELDLAQHVADLGGEKILGDD